MLSALIDLLLFAVICLAAVTWLRARSGVRSRIAARARAVSATPGAQAENQTVLQSLQYRLARLGERLPLLDATQRTKLALLLRQAGWRNQLALPVFASIKFGSGIALVLLQQSLLPAVLGDTLSMQALVGLGTFVAGMILPEYLLKFRVSQRQKEVEAALPNALDLLVICTNAGYSLPASFERTAHELKRVSPVLADELALTTHELQLSGDRHTALRNLAERVGTSSVRSLVATLIQAQQYGTPITQSLRTLAKSERNARMLSLEERAAKLATKITIPMILFILPTVILIAGGPAALNLMAAFGGR